MVDAFEVSKLVSERMALLDEYLSEGVAVEGVRVLRCG